jgi:hypothetical protein
LQASSSAGRRWRREGHPASLNLPRKVVDHRRGEFLPIRKVVDRRRRELLQMTGLFAMVITIGLELSAIDYVSTAGPPL